MATVYRGMAKELLMENSSSSSSSSSSIFKVLDSSSISRCKQLVSSRLGLAFAASGNRVARISYKASMTDLPPPGKRRKLEDDNSSGVKDEELDMNCRVLHEAKERYESAGASERSDGKPLLGFANDRGLVRLMTYEKDIDSLSICSELKMECEINDSSWQGVAFESYDDPSRLAVANERNRVVSIFDIEKESRSRDMRTTFWPSCVVWGNNKCVFVTSQDTLNVFDPRNRTKNGLTHRLQPFRGDNLFAVVSSGEKVMVAGRRGSVYLYDTRKWTLGYRWNAPVKYSVQSLLVSPRGDLTTYAVGTDYELMCSGANVGHIIGKKKSAAGTHRSKLRLNHSTGLRGASRWLGASLVPHASKDEDTLLCLCEKGEFYCVRGAEKMNHAAA